MNLEPQGVMDGEGDEKELGVRGLYKGDSKDLDMAAQDTTTLLKEFPLVGHRGVVGTAGAGSGAMPKQQRCQSCCLATGMLS